MNYLALAGALIAAAISSVTMLRIIAVSLGKQRFVSEWGMALAIIQVAAWGTGAAFLFAVAVGA